MEAFVVGSETTSSFFVGRRMEVKSSNSLVRSHLQDCFVYLPLICRGAQLSLGGGRRTETVLVKNPEDREILELVDVECSYPDARPNKCTAPTGYRCPYRRYKTSPHRTADVEFLSTDTVRSGEREDRDAVELVDLDCMYPEARYSECAAHPSYRCAYRQYNTSLPSAYIGMLSRSESGLSHSQPLRLLRTGMGQAWARGQKTSAH